MLTFRIFLALMLSAAALKAQEPAEKLDVALTASGPVFFAVSAPRCSPARTGLPEGVRLLSGTPQARSVFTLKPVNDGKARNRWEQSVVFARNSDLSGSGTLAGFAAEGGSARHFASAMPVFTNNSGSALTAPESSGGSLLSSDPQPADSQVTTPRPKVFTYSDAYYRRLKIHKYASFATVPLFIAESVVGEKLYNSTPGSGPRSAHTALAAGIAVLFGVNSVTGVWNLWDARKDPNGRTKRMAHSILMLVSDAGFVATGALAHGQGRGLTAVSGSNATHRAVAFTSMGVATVGYLIMLFGR